MGVVRIISKKLESQKTSKTSITKKLNKVNDHYQVSRGLRILLMEVREMWV